MKIQVVAQSVGALLAAVWVGTAGAAPLTPSLPAGAMFAALSSASEPEETRTDLRRQVVSYRTQAMPGTVVIDTAHTFLYYVLGDGTAIRYGIGVGREGFTWTGAETVTR